MKQKIKLRIIIQLNKSLHSHPESTVHVITTTSKRQINFFIMFSLSEIYLFKDLYPYNILPFFFEKFFNFLKKYSKIDKNAKLGIMPDSAFFALGTLCVHYYSAMIIAYNRNIVNILFFRLTQKHCNYFTTIFTILLGTEISLTIVLPSIAACTFSSALAIAIASSLSQFIGSITVARSLPLT